MNPRADFSLAQLSEPLKVDPVKTEKAASHLRWLYEQGMLRTLPGWEEDPLEGWMDLLGLNGRPIRLNHGPGLRN